jgi:hypothetical protein
MALRVRESLSELPHTRGRDANRHSGKKLATTAELAGVTVVLLTVRLGKTAGP